MHKTTISVKWCKIEPRITAVSVLGRPILKYRDIRIGVDIFPRTNYYFLASDHSVSNSGFQKVSDACSVRLFLWGSLYL